MKRVVHFIQMAPLSVTLLLTGAFPCIMRGQALPTAAAETPYQGFQLPSTAGTLSYGISASESINRGYYANGTTATTNVSGDLGYLSSSKADPTSVVFSGGYFYSTSGQPSTEFANLGLSQTLSSKNTRLNLSDTVSYLPQTATTGLSGIAGTGDLGIPVPPGTGQDVLSNYSARVNNTAAATLQQSLTGSTSLQGSGTYSILRFVNAGAGLDTDQISASAGLNHRIDARNSAGANYSYSESTYGGSQFNLVGQTAALQYSRQMTRQFSVSVSAGPQWISGSSSGLSGPSINVFASASANYSGEVTSEEVGYSRGNNSGSGVSQGSLSDRVSGSIHRRIGRPWNVSATASYSHTASLPGALTGYFSTNTFVTGGQVSRAILRSLSTYASYNLSRQSGSNLGSTVNVFTGVSQVIAFGITYSPMPIRLGRP
jgi:hypothetical protein